MNEAEHWNSRVRPIRLENPYRLPFRGISLAMVRDDHAHIMAPARQCPTEQRLLNRFAADGMLSIFRRQDREIVEPDETDFHRLTDPSAVLAYGSRKPLFRRAD
jgi:hypothetical protein